MENIWLLIVLGLAPPLVTTLLAARFGVSVVHSETAIRAKARPFTGEVPVPAVIFERVIHVAPLPALWHFYRKVKSNRPNKMCGTRFER